MQAETRRLEAIAQDYDNPLCAKEIAAFEIYYCFEIFKRFYRGGDVLEMGAADGIMTKYLVHHVESLEVLEGSKTFCKKLEENFSNLPVHCCLFEDFKPQKTYDAIIMGHVLEHVESPAKILQIAKTWLKPKGAGGGGIIFAAVPNAHSIHRQAAVEMGILESEAAMSEADIFHGHRRIYDLETLKLEFLSVGLEIITSGGYWLKPLSNAQIQKDWTQEMVLAFMRLGERYPTLAGDIYIVAQ